MVSPSSWSTRFYSESITNYENSPTTNGNKNNIHWIVVVPRRLFAVYSNPPYYLLVHCGAFIRQKQRAGSKWRMGNFHAPKLFHPFVIYRFCLHFNGKRICYNRKTSCKGPNVCAPLFPIHLSCSLEVLYCQRA